MNAEVRFTDVGWCWPKNPTLVCGQNGIPTWNRPQFQFTLPGHCDEDLISETRHQITPKQEAPHEHITALPLCAWIPIRGHGPAQSHAECRVFIYYGCGCPEVCFPTPELSHEILRTKCPDFYLCFSSLYPSNLPRSRPKGVFIKLEDKSSWICF